MNFKKVVKAIGTTLDLKRFASAYVIDHRQLSEQEIRAALEKTAPQYFHRENVFTALDEIVYHADREVRTIGPIFLKHILLNADEFLLEPRETDDQIIDWEQSVIDAANQNLLENRKGEKAEPLTLFQFVVETAWQQNQSISVDEKHLIEKLKQRLRVTDREYRTIEASLGKFPKPGNEVHNYSEIDETRRILQSKGLVAAIRDNGKTDYDVIPSEIAVIVRKYFNVEIREHGYKELLASKHVRKRAYFTEVLQKCGIDVPSSPSLDDLYGLLLERVPPTTVIGGTSPKDGLQMDELKKWCSELSQPVSGHKQELIERIVSFYDQLNKRDEVIEDERSLWYSHFESLGARDLGFLKSQQIIEKDNEVERKFESATDFLFENYLGHKPLKMHGNEHPDGILSYGDSLLMWDNKSKESEVKLSQHVSQIHRYVNASEKRVAGFLVIGPSFTGDSGASAMEFFAKYGVMITLITAGELKLLAEAWREKQGSSEAVFPLAYLIQSGRFNRGIVPI